MVYEGYVAVVCCPVSLHSLVAIRTLWNDAESPGVKGISLDASWWWNGVVWIFWRVSGLGLFRLLSVSIHDVEDGIRVGVPLGIVHRILLNDYILS